MDGGRFDDMARLLGAVPRRRVLGAAVGALIAGVAGTDHAAAACRADAEACRTNYSCCSGDCVGKRKRRRCRQRRAQGTCGRAFTTASCNGRTDCRCYSAPGLERVCGSNPIDACLYCRTDLDCRGAYANVQGFFNRDQRLYCVNDYACPNSRTCVWAC